MAEVTVCIPAYRCAAFIAQTLESVRGQSFTDFVADIALEPDDAAAAEQVMAPFLEDPRFRLEVNPVTYGWHVNVGRLLGRVETPYFAVLAHDDLWHPDFLRETLDVLRDRADASVAYSDVFVFGASSGLRWAPLPDAPLGQRLLAHFLLGAESTPWRGVTRREVLVGPFPGNPFNGFGAEVEWSLHLVVHGAALRVPQPLFLKRLRRDEDSVSEGWRSATPEAVLRLTLDHHREAMLVRVPQEGIDAGERADIILAAEAAMLRRWVNIAQGRFAFGDQEDERIHRIIREGLERGTPIGREIAGRALLTLSRYMFGRGDRAESERLAREAVKAAPDDREGWATLARLLLGTGRTAEAIPAVVRAARLGPMAPGIRQLEIDCAQDLDRTYPWKGPGAGA